MLLRRKKTNCSPVLVPRASRNCLFSTSPKTRPLDYHSPHPHTTSVSLPQAEKDIAACPEDPRFLWLNTASPSQPFAPHSCHTTAGGASFFTAGDKEVHAWTLRQGRQRARSCRCVIHSDMEKGFIRAGTRSFEDLIAFGGTAEAPPKAAAVEGKSLHHQDGDIIEIRFNI
jgi:hypothetical protein